MRTTRTARLTLRPFTPADAPRVALLAGEWDVARMCARIPYPYPVLLAEGWIDMQSASADQLEDFPFAITTAQDGLIGSCGVTRHGHSEDSPPAQDVGDSPFWEIGYWLGRPYWGRGYATEASAALMEWALRELGVQAFTAGHYLDNPNSGKVLRKLGFVATGEAELFSLARREKAPAMRYVWPADAAAIAPSNDEAAHLGFGRR